MNKNYSSEDYTETNIVHGAHMYIEKKKIIGFCTYPPHRGAITKSVIKSHGCVKKNAGILKKATMLIGKIMKMSVN